MPTSSPANLRAFVRRETRLKDVPGIAGLRLHLASDVTTTWRAAGERLGQPDPPMPFWAFAWAGGLAIARHLVAHPELVRSRDVLDVATGSGLCAITAALAGAATVHAIDVDPLAEAATAVNARANGVRIGFSRVDAATLAGADADVILAGDVCYEGPMSEALVGWLRREAGKGSLVLIGDPGRIYLPGDLVPLATYDVVTSRELEAGEVTRSTVYTFPR